MHNNLFTNLLIETNNVGDIMLAEVIEVIFGRVDGIAVIVAIYMVRASKSNELLWQYPVEIPVFHALRVAESKEEMM